MLHSLFDRWYAALPAVSSTVGTLQRLAQRAPGGEAGSVDELEVVERGPGDLLWVSRWAATLALAGGDESRALACGDDVFVELDLAAEHLPHGSAITIGEVILRVESARSPVRFEGRARRRARRHDRRGLGGRRVGCSVLSGGRLRVGDSVFVKSVGIRFQP